MGNSLQEQMLKLGLVNEQKLRQTKHEQRNQEKQRKGPPPAEERRQQVQKTQIEKAERDRELNRKRQEETERKALAAQVKQMIEAGRLPKGDGEIAYNFIDGRKVRRLYVNATVHRQLTGGTAMIVKLHGRYEIVPTEVAEKIRERDPTTVVALDQGPAEGEADESYAKYQVPDDLMW